MADTARSAHDVTLSTILAIDPHVRFRRFDDEAVVIQQESAEVLIMNDVAARLLELVDGERSLADCAGLIEQEFDTTRAQIEEDLLRFAAELIGGGVAVDRSRT